ncbi:unnamed protein product [Trichogramma brassicae]|uniref:Uncharacterized protein n=1 Tax=Trichogramma brassicae TaxID=86971 RepID=A0A6H5IZK4_9HYME|nr:unnamed protein product [Trichogramma brassicae]
MSRRVKPIVKDVKSEGAGNSAPGPAACIYRGPSAGNNSKEERSRSAERIQREPASPSEKDPAPATTLRRSKRILPPVHYYEDESDVSAWHISRFLELYSTTTSSDERGSAHISTSKSPGKRLKRASIKAKCSCPALTLHGAIGAPASTSNAEKWILSHWADSGRRRFSAASVLLRCDSCPEPRAKANRLFFARANRDPARNREICGQCRRVLTRKPRENASIQIRGYWSGQLPADLRQIFLPHRFSVDRLLTEALFHGDPPSAVVDFVVRTGYRDQPDLDRDGNPLLRRSTALHLAFKSRHPHRTEVARGLFQIYQANYVDEDGLTHYHVALWFGFDEVVQRFRELQPDGPGLLGNDPLLHRALRDENRELVERLLRYGADPNEVDVERGTTPLLSIVRRQLPSAYVFARLIFEVCARPDVDRAVRVDARDNSCNTALHWAMDSDDRRLIELLLRQGADPNLSNVEGSTALHVVCRRDRDDAELVARFFEVCGEIGRPVRVDARDRWGRTPLQWAVARLLPNVVAVLLDKGADLSQFVFPTERHLAEIPQSRYWTSWPRVILRLQAGALACVEQLEKKGYELQRSDATSVMRLIGSREMFQKPSDVEEFFEDYAEFEVEARRAEVRSTGPRLTLHDLVHLPPGEEATRRFAYSEYVDLAESRSAESYGLWQLLPDDDKIRGACEEHLSEAMARGFFPAMGTRGFLAVDRPSAAYRLLPDYPRASDEPRFVLHLLGGCGS